jgi:uncharacterized protein (DUF362 family)
MKTPKPSGSRYRLWQSLFEKTFSRAQFMRWLGAALAALALPTRWARQSAAAQGRRLTPRARKNLSTLCPLAAVEGTDPGAITRAAVEALGGMRRFVRPGDTVVVKPNIGWDRRPEYAANTHPAVVAAVAQMAFEAGAKRVRVFDNTCNDPRLCYANSGIQAAAKAVGAMVYYPVEHKYIPAASRMADWPLYKDAVECDCLINVPVAKHHATTGLSLAIKNLMGICGGFRGMMHLDLDEKLVELVAFMRPELTVIDAVRILLRNGPTGGRLEDVARKNTVIASADMVLADAYATTLFERAPDSIRHIKMAAEAGLGSINISQEGMVRKKI